MLVGHTDHSEDDEESSQNIFFLFLANNSLGSNAFICVAADPVAKLEPLLTVIFIFQYLYLSVWWQIPKLQIWKIPKLTNTQYDKYQSCKKLKNTQEGNLLLLTQRQTWAASDSAKLFSQQISLPVKRLIISCMSHVADNKLHVLIFF